MVVYLAGQSVDVDHTVPGQWPVSLRMQGVLYLARQCVVADGTVPGLAVCGCRQYLPGLAVYGCSLSKTSLNCTAGVG